MAQTRSKKIAAVTTRTRSGRHAASITQASATTRTKSGKIAKPKPRDSQGDITAKTAKAVQKSIDRLNLAIEPAGGSNSAKTAAIADGALTRDTGNTTENHAPNNPASSSIEGPASNDPAPTTSTTGAASTCETNGTTEQNAPPMASTQPANTTTNNSASPPSTTTAATADATPSPPDAIGQVSTIANDCPELNTRGKARSLARAKSVRFEVPEPVPESVPVNARRSEPRRSGETDVDPIIVDDAASIAGSVKQVLRYRQNHLENMKPLVDNLLEYINSTADSDQSGDYEDAGVGHKRSFEEFITSELDDSDQPIAFAYGLIYEMEEYQGMLQRTKEFQRQ